MFRPSRIMLAARGWIRTRRRSRRFFFLLLCSPLLIPLVLFTFPILCVAELCLRVCSHEPWERVHEDCGEEERACADDARLRACEEGYFCDGGGEQMEREREVGLLQRYLEDQLRLVGSVYECGDDFDYDEDVGTLGWSRSPLLG
ncbi:hypothetical protein SAY86_020528 [Trapa natans]|uniref:Uncharacterized protein n=1 Tax=Trapa natans TaxID=22666 RepID=A0AAN7LQN4_TRANT|nr:hypothetical protein SAY86_020528 [Trapa natans]